MIQMICTNACWLDWLVTEKNGSKTFSILLGKLENTLTAPLCFFLHLISTFTGFELSHQLNNENDCLNIVHIGAQTHSPNESLESSCDSWENVKLNQRKAMHNDLTSFLSVSIYETHWLGCMEMRGLFPRIRIKSTAIPELVNCKTLHFDTSGMM